MLKSDITINYQLNTGDVDFNKQMKISKMLYFFQEIAVEHATQLGVGFESMQNRGLLWVLAKIKIKIYSMPKLDSKIIIKSWIRQAKFATYPREYQILTSEGEIMISASSVWCILNINDHSLYKGETPFKDVEYLTIKAVDDKLKHIPFDTENINDSHLRDIKIIKYSDIDYNMHFNNTRFSEVIMDCFSLDFLNKNTVDTIQINFTNEGKFGNELFTYLIEDSGTFKILTNNKTLNNELLEAEVKFR